MSMVEKVAVAIIEKHGLDNIGLGHARELARVAIEAMMEPSEEACRIAREERGFLDRTSYSALIQAALKEGQ